MAIPIHTAGSIATMTDTFWSNYSVGSKRSPTKRMRYSAILPTSMLDRLQHILEWDCVSMDDTHVPEKRELRVILMFALTCSPAD